MAQSDESSRSSAGSPLLVDDIEGDTTVTGTVTRPSPQLATAATTNQLNGSNSNNSVSSTTSGRVSYGQKANPPLPLPTRNLDECAIIRSSMAAQQSLLSFSIASILGSKNVVHHGKERQLQDAGKLTHCPCPFF